MKKNLNNEEKASIIPPHLLQHSILIIWKPDYELGIPVVDEQHRGIVATINSLYYGMQHKHGESMLMPIADMVYDYTRIHFEVEEDFLKKCKFPDLDSHQSLHKELIDELHQFRRETILKKDSIQFIRFLKKWWVDHICDKDRQFREYLLILLNFFLELTR